MALGLEGSGGPPSYITILISPITTTYGTYNHI